MNSMEEDINNLIEELTNVRPDELSTEGLKLFNKINEIIDINKELEEEYRIILNSKVGVDLSFDDYIPVSLVEEKIEELIKEGRHYNANKIEVLQELLEKR